MADNITAIIEIKSIEPKQYPENTDYVLKDQVGRIFHVYKFKKGTQEESLAYKQMQTMELRVALSKDIPVKVEVWYAEVPNKHGGTTRYIASFKEAGDNDLTPVQPQGSQTGESSNLGHSGASGGPSNDAFGRRLALHGFVNGMLANGATVETITRDLPALLKLEDEIEKVLNPSSFRQQVSKLAPKVVMPDEDLPSIQINDDVQAITEDVPF